MLSVADSKILVLGSGGLVGSALTRALEEKGHDVHQVKHRLDTDLRFEAPPHGNYSFCFFLACEVGGSKFLTAEHSQDQIQLYNEQMYQVVLPFLKENGIPFLFSSSMLAGQPTAYGKVKLLGEELTNATGVGKIVVFYNVYGYEKINTKSHVISDYVYNCLRSRGGNVQAHTDGAEFRQFSHSTDVAEGLIELMTSFDSLPPRTELTSGIWTSLKEIGNIVEEIGGCKISYTTEKSMLEKGPEPLHPHIVHTDLRVRIKEMFLEYERKHEDAKYYLSVVVSTGYSVLDAAKLASLVRDAKTLGLRCELLVLVEGPFTDEMSMFFRELDATSVVNTVIQRRFLPGNLQPYEILRSCAHFITGQFVMYVERGAVIPFPLLEQISKEQFDHGMMYSAFEVPHKSEIAAFALFCTLAPSSCPFPALKNQLSDRNVTFCISRTAALSSRFGALQKQRLRHFDHSVWFDV